MTHRMRITRKDQLCIATAHGMITICIGGRRNEFLIDLPDALKLARGLDRAFESSDHLALVDGKVFPKFDVLTPVKDAHGALVCLETKTVRRMATPVIRAVQTA
jgi:hypothetical protein